MKAAAQKVECSISVLATAVDNIETADKDKDVNSAAKSVVIAAAASQQKQKVTNATHSALTRIATRQMSAKDGE